MITLAINKILGIAIHHETHVQYFDLNDEEIILTAAQKNEIQPLLDNGVPEVIDVAAVKIEASRRILALLPAHKQANTLARSSELLEILAGGGTLTAEEEADRLATKAAWAEVSAIRAASNTIESQELPTDYLGLIDAFNAILV
jgi:hypothetical protein